MDHTSKSFEHTGMVEVTKGEAHLENASFNAEGDGAHLLGTKDERRVVRKQDLLIIPTLFAIFFLGYLVSNFSCVAICIGTEPWLLTGSWCHWQRTLDGTSKRLADQRSAVLSVPHDIL